MAFQETEQNGNLQTANLVAVNSTFQGSMGANADLDYYKIQPSAGGKLTLNFTHPNGAGTTGGNIRLLLKDSDGTVITSKDFTGNGSLETTIPSSGDYYVTVMEADKYTTTFTAGIYSVATNFVTEPNSAYDGADNNDLGTAVSKLADGVTTLTPGGVIHGTMGSNADLDYFKVQSSAGGKLTLNFTHPNGAGTTGGNIRLLLKDSDGTVITSKDFTGNGILETTVPSSGDYYVTVMEADKYTTTFTAGIYSVATNFVSEPNSAYDGADNNDLGTAVSKLADGVTTLTSNHVMRGSLGANADVDYFKVQTGAGGPVSVDFTHPNGLGTAGGKITVQLKDASGAMLASKDFTGSGKLDAVLSGSGDYFVCVIDADSYTNTFTEGTYSIQIVNLIDEPVIVDPGNESFTGGPGNDTFTGGQGDDTINGAGGIDTSTYSGLRSNFTVAKSGAGFTVTDTKGNEGIDTLIDVERLQFADKKLALDLGSTQNGGQSVKFIGALAYPLAQDAGVFGQILSYFDQGYSLSSICNLAVNVGLTASLAGSGSNAALAKLVFRNLVGGEADAATTDLLVGFMDGRHASYTQGEFLAAVADLDLNQEHIGLVGLQLTGLEYA